MVNIYWPSAQCMKTLYIIRHAQSNQMHLGKDIERPLTHKGQADAAQQAQWLKAQVPHTPVFIASPAKRTQQTMQAFLAAFNVSQEQAISINTLYHAHPETYYTLIKELPKNIDAVAIISHNPGITFLANALNCGFAINDFPPCGILAVSLKQWSDIEFGKMEFLFFKEP